VLIAGLACIRAFEKQVFYDPFAVYFEGEYLNLPFPEYDFLRLIGSMSLRYLLNMLVSVAIIFTLFKDWNLVRFSTFLYAAFFVILMAAFVIIITSFTHDQNFILFYVRRFLIQPLFLLLFVPAFYYQSRLTKNNKI